MKKLLILTILALISLEVDCQNSPSLQAKLDSVQTATGYPGIVFTFIDSVGKIQSVASGYADLDRGIKMTPQHRLHGGSTGKTVVSAVMMQLIQEDKISLDDRVEEHLGAYEWYDRLANAETITVRHLMQHSSGIIRYEFKQEFLDDLSKEPSKIWKPEELLAYVLDDEPPFAAGEGFTYSDTNYILLGMIIEKITDNDFYEEAERRVLKPLQLSSFSPTTNPKIEKMAQGYYAEGSEYALGFKQPFLVDGVAQNNMQFEWTGGGYVYENQEYAQLLRAIYEGQVFDLSVVGDDFFDFIDAKEIRGQYGLGTIRYLFPVLGEFIGHSGFFPGYNTMGFYHTATKQTFTMQANSTELVHLQKFFSDYLELVGLIVTK